MHAQVTSNTVTVIPKADDSATGELRFREKLANGVNYVGYKAPASIAANAIWQLPGVDGIGAQCSDGALGLTYDLCAFLTTSSSPSLGLRIYGSQDKELITIDRFGGSTIPGLYVTRSNGTVASPTAVVNGDNLAIFAAGGHDGSAIQRAQAWIYAQAEGNWSGSSRPVRWIITTTATGSTSPVTRWLFQNNGDLLPGANSTYFIGSTGSRLAGIFSANGDLSGTLTYRAANGDLATLAASNGAGLGSAFLVFTGTSIRPSSSGGSNLGGSTLPWATGWINQIVSTTACSGCISISTTSPITGGTITGSGTIGCSTCVVDNGTQTIGGNKTFSGSTTFSGTATFSSTATFNSAVAINSASTLAALLTLNSGGGLRISSDLCCTIGTNTNRVSTVWASGLGNVDTLTLTSIGAIFAPNGNAGVSATKTVRDAAGTGTCTLIYSAGILTGGTC